MNYTVLLAAALSASPAPSTPAPSTGAAPQVTATFSSIGVTTVVLRAGSASEASVAVVEPTLTFVKVSGIPTGGAKGYHPSDPKWKETSPTEWGLEFVAKRFGATLVISSKNEMHYIHHHYAFEHLRVEVPSGIAVVREPRVLSGDGAPDLKPPTKAPTPATRPTDRSSQK